MDDRDFDLKYRPQTLAEVVGQPAAVKTIKSWGDKIPRALLFYGDSGCGKTTTARVVVYDLLKIELGSMDLQQKNCARAPSALDMVRDIQSNMTASSMKTGGKRVWVLDEVQTLSQTPRAQELLLTVLEDCPSHVQFILCTTEPKRLKPAIVNRCVAVEFKPIPDADIEALVVKIAKAEAITLTEEVRERIVALASRCARDAVKLLQKISGIKGEGAQLEALGSGFSEGGTEFSLVKALLPWKGAPTWPAVRKVLLELDESDPEGLRCMILASARSALLKGGGNDPLLFKAIGLLSDPMDDRRSGKALLAARCFQICNTK